MENKRPLVSIIVPIYNSEEYLDRCIQSLVNQSFVEIEIVLVNDGSTDASPSICDAWAEKDSRIVVIHNVNQGVTKARQTGVENARGEWISFVDSDDELFQESIGLLLAHVSDDVDMICGSLRYTGPYKFKREYEYAPMNSLEYTKKLFKKKVTWGPFGRLTRLSLFDPSSFDISPIITHGEDFIMNIRLGQRAKRIVLIPDFVYHYIWRANSAVSKNPMESKAYRKVLRKELHASLPSESLKAMKRTFVRYWIARYWEIFKVKVKRMLKFIKSK